MGDENNLGFIQLAGGLTHKSLNSLTETKLGDHLVKVTVVNLHLAHPKLSKAIILNKIPT